VNVKRFLVIGAAATVAFATVTACDSASKSPTPSTSSASSASSQASAPSDEQQIRDLLNQEQTDMASLDTDKILTVTCTKYHDADKKNFDQMIPAISQIGTADEVEGKAEELASQFKQQFPKSSDATIKAYTDAITSYDQAAYEKAYKAGLMENFTLTMDKVENIKVTGDSATADVTSTETDGNQPPKTKTENMAFVRESGEWKDCQPPS
jgi:hypothetical protein